MKTVDEKYFACIQRFPLVEITENNYQSAMNMLNHLLHRKLSNGEREYRKLLERLIAEYEKPYSDHLVDIDPSALLAGLMELHDLTQTDIAHIIGCRQSYVSALVRGQRPISEQTAIRLGKYFQLDPNRFRVKIRVSATA